MKCSRVPQRNFSISWPWTTVEFRVDTKYCRSLHFHFLDMNYSWVPQHIFHFVGMKYRRSLQLNFSTSRTWNLPEFCNRAFFTLLTLNLCELSKWFSVGFFKKYMQWLWYFLLKVGNTLLIKMLFVKIYEILYEFQT